MESTSTAQIPNDGGTLTISVAISDGPSGPPGSPGAPDWNADAGSAFAPSSTDALPHFARYDFNSTQVSGGATDGGYRPSGFVQLVTDRPVSVTAQALQWSTGGTCGGAPQTQTTMSTSHSFRWDNLCFGTEYDFVAVVTDAAGVRTSFGLAGGGTVLGTIFTQQLPIEQISYAYGFTFHESQFSYGVNATADGVIIGAHPIGEVSGPCQPESSGPPVLGTPLTNLTEHGYPIDLPESVPVTFTIDIGTGPYCEDQQRVVLTGHVKLTDLISGTPVTMTADSPLVGVTATLSAVTRFAIQPSEH